jgi:hypothetical protein
LKENTVRKNTKKYYSIWYLGVSKIADLETRSWVTIQQRVLQFQVPVANLLKAQTNLGIPQLISIKMEKKKGSISGTEVCYPHHEVAVANATNQLLEEVPRLEQKGKYQYTNLGELWTKQE